MRHPAEQNPVGAEKTAIGTGDEDAQGDETDRVEHHPEIVAHAENRNKGIVAADEEGGPGCRKQDRKSQVHIAKKAQHFLQPPGDRNRFHHHQILNRAQRTNRRAEGAAEEQSKYQRNHEEGQHRQGNDIIREKQRRGDVLQRAHRAHAALPDKTEVNNRKHRHRPDGPARAFFEGKIAGQSERNGQHKHIHPFAPGASGRGRLGRGLLIAALKLRFGETGRVLRKRGGIDQANRQQNKHYP